MAFDFLAGELLIGLFVYIPIPHQSSLPEKIYLFMLTGFILVSVCVFRVCVHMLNA